MNAPPNIKIPSITIPKFQEKLEFNNPYDLKLPSINIPKSGDVSSFAIPKIKIPSSVPSIENIPSLDKIDIPSINKINKSTINLPNIIRQESTQEEIESQEKRDKLARRAYETYIKNKKTAKEYEVKVNKAREEAKVKREIALNSKREAQIAKGDACKTRPGGRYLCIRPFGIGY